MLDKIPFFIGLRYTRAKRRNHFISFISLTSMIGLTLGVAVLILVLSVMNGFDRELRQRILGMVPHATVFSQSSFQDWPEVAQELEKDERIIAAVPYVKAQGMFSARGNVRGALVNGVLPEQEGRVSIIDQHMKYGNLDDLRPGEFGIVLGDLLARFLGVTVGDKVTLMVPEASITPAGVFPRMKRFTVVGMFSVGADLDGSLAVAHLQDMQTLMRLGDDIHGLRLQLTDLFDARQVVWEQLQDMPRHMRGSDWTRTHGNLFQAIQMEKRMIGLLLTIIIAVAAFNIVSTLVMVVTDKQGDIAILRTLGATPGMIMGIFIVQGVVIGLTGTAIGTGLGVLAALNVSDFVAWVEQLFDIQFLDSNVYFISYLPSELRMDDVWVIVSSALVMSFLSTLYPAWRASRIQPADALRYE